MFCPCNRSDKFIMQCEGATTYVPRYDVVFYGFSILFLLLFALTNQMIIRQLLHLHNLDFEMSSIHTYIRFWFDVVVLNNLYVLPCLKLTEEVGPHLSRFWFLKWSFLGPRGMGCHQSPYISHHTTLWFIYIIKKNGSWLKNPLNKGSLGVRTNF